MAWGMEEGWKDYLGIIEKMGSLNSVQRAENKCGRNGILTRKNQTEILRYFESAKYVTAIASPAVGLRLRPTLHHTEEN